MLKRLFGFAMIIALLFVGSTFVTKNSSNEVAGIFDRFNPLVPSGEVYVKTTKPESVNGYGTALYRQTAADKDGNTRPVEFNGMTELKVGHYLKLSNKGAYIETYEEVAKEAVPAKALEQIDK